MPRRAGAGAVGLALGVAAVATLLGACSKPTPQVSVLANRTVSRISPQTYCFDAKHCRINSSAVGDIRAASGSTILVDVPSAVADPAWQVQAVTQDAKTGKITPVESPGASSGTLSGRHSTRVDVPVLTGNGNYLLLIRAGAGPRPVGTWVAQVTVTPA